MIEMAAGDTTACSTPSRLVNAQIATTKSGEQAVKAAIVNYVLRNNCLPWGNSPICPKLYAKNS